MNKKYAYDEKDAEFLAVQEICGGDRRKIMTLKVKKIWVRGAGVKYVVCMRLETDEVRTRTYWHIE